MYMQVNFKLGLVIILELNGMLSNYKNNSYFTYFMFVEVRINFS